MTVYEILTLLEIRGVAEREDLETEAQVIRIAVNSAMSGKPIKLFEEKAKAVRGSLEDREKELRALDDLGL